MFPLFIELVDTCSETTTIGKNQVVAEKLFSINSLNNCTLRRQEKVRVNNLKCSQVKGLKCTRRLKKLQPTSRLYICQTQFSLQA